MFDVIAAERHRFFTIGDRLPGAAERGFGLAALEIELPEGLSLRAGGRLRFGLGIAFRALGRIRFFLIENGGDVGDRAGRGRQTLSAPVSAPIHVRARTAKTPKTRQECAKRYTGAWRFLPRETFGIMLR